MITRKITILLFLTVELCACSHPVEIVGGGDVLSATGTRNCYLEDFLAGKDSCARNLVVEEYFETYYAMPRRGWKFAGWKNYCEDSADAQCKFELATAIVNQYWGVVMPPLIAVFSPVGQPGLEQATVDSNAVDQREAAKQDTVPTATKTASASVQQATVDSNAVDQREAAKQDTVPTATKTASASVQQATVDSNAVDQREAAKQDTVPTATKTASASVQQATVDPIAVDQREAAAQDTVPTATKTASASVQQAIVDSDAVDQREAATQDTVPIATKAASASVPVQQAAIPSGSANLRWSIPTTRQDGASLNSDELLRYEIYITAQATGQRSVLPIHNPLQTNYTVSNLLPGVYHFAMVAVDKTGLYSRQSAVISLSIGI